MFNYSPVFLDPPLESKILIRKGSPLFRVGAACMQGRRVDMEDTHCISLSLPKHPDTGLFAIYDGHGGKVTSQYLGEHFHHALDNIPHLHHKPNIVSTVIDIDQKIKDIKNTEHDGSTAVFALAEKQKGQYLVSIGNIGDSRAVLFKGGTKPMPLTKDHVPSIKREKMRIVKAGGTVEGGRVMGQLAVSRAFGDNALKLPTNCPPEHKMVSCIPEFKDINVTCNDYLLLTCDGIFEKEQVFTLDSLAAFLAEQFRHTNDLAHICSSLLDETLRRGSRDNMTALLIQFQDGSDYHQEREEFVPGPYHEGPFLTPFQKAYILNAKAAGKTLNDAKRMYAERMAKEDKNKKTTNNGVSSPRPTPSNLDHSPKKATDFYTDSNSKSGYESDSDSDSSDSDSTETTEGTRPNHSPKSPDVVPKDPKVELPPVHAVPVPPLVKKSTDINLFQYQLAEEKLKPNKEEKRSWSRPKIRIGPRVESENEENTTTTTTTSTVNTNSSPTTNISSPKSRYRKKKEKQLRRKSESEIPKPRLPSCDEPESPPDSLLKSESIPQNKKVPSKFFVSFIKHLPLKLHKIEKPEEPESESLYAMGLSPRKFSTELESPVNVHSETSSSNATLPPQHPPLKSKKSQPRLKMEQPLEIEKEKHKEVVPKQATKQPTPQPLQRSKEAKSNGRVTPVSGRNGLHVAPSLPAKEETEKGLAEIVHIMDPVNTKL